MEALKIKAFAHKGMLSIPVPEEFEEKELDVIILSANDKSELSTNDKTIKEEGEVKKFVEMSSSERLAVLQQYKGTAKFSNFPVNKYDVYDQ